MFQFGLCLNLEHSVWAGGQGHIEHIQSLGAQPCVWDSFWKPGHLAGTNTPTWPWTVHHLPLFIREFSCHLLSLASPAVELGFVGRGSSLPEVLSSGFWWGSLWVTCWWSTVYMLLGLVCWQIIKAFCICIHEWHWSVAFCPLFLLSELCSPSGMNWERVSPLWGHTPVLPGVLSRVCWVLFCVFPLIFWVALVRRVKPIHLGRKPRHFFFLKFYWVTIDM